MTLRRRVGQLLCRLSFHKWHQEDAVDHHADFWVVTSYAWCDRPGCDQRTIVVNQEKHWKPQFDGSWIDT